MEPNIPAILALFPKKAPSASHSRTHGMTIQGPFPYDTFRRLLPGDLDPAFVAAVEAVRNDVRWGPVYRGNLSAYGGDHSAADLALCGEFARLGLKGPAVDTAFRSSALYRDKWERDDYRERTIGLAMSSAVPVQQAPTVRQVGLLALENGRLDASTDEPPPRDWLVEGMLLAGKTAVLAGFGGVSKTQLALQLSVAIAVNSPFLGRAIKPGNVLMISGEEDQAELNRRVNALIRHDKMSSSQRAAVRSNLLAFPMVGKDIRLTIRVGGTLESTGFDEHIIQAAQEQGDVRLIVLDHIGLLHGGDFSAKEDAALTMRIINGIAEQTGAAVIVLAHAPKGSLKEEVSDASMIFGSTAFVEQARGGWVMATMRPAEAKELGIREADRKQYVSLVGVKANYSPEGLKFWLERNSFDEVGLLDHVHLTPPAPAAKSGVALEANIIAAVRNAPGQYSKTRTREAFAGKKDGPWKASKGEIERAIEDLVSAGVLINRAPTSAERAKYAHGPRVTHVLDLGASDARAAR